MMDAAETPLDDSPAPGPGPHVPRRLPRPHIPAGLRRAPRLDNELVRAPRSPLGKGYNWMVHHVLPVRIFDEWWWIRNLGSNQGFGYALEFAVQLLCLTVLKLPMPVYVPISKVVGHADEMHMAYWSMRSRSSLPINKPTLFDRTDRGAIEFLGGAITRGPKHPGGPRGWYQMGKGLWAARRKLLAGVKRAPVMWWRQEGWLPTVFLNLVMPVAAAFVITTLKAPGWSIYPISYSPLIPMFVDGTRKFIRDRDAPFKVRLQHIFQPHKAAHRTQGLGLGAIDMAALDRFTLVVDTERPGLAAERGMPSYDVEAVQPHPLSPWQRAKLERAMYAALSRPPKLSLTAPVRVARGVALGRDGILAPPRAVDTAASPPASGSAPGPAQPTRPAQPGRVRLPQRPEPNAGPRSDDGHLIVRPHAPIRLEAHPAPRNEGRGGL